MNRELETYDEDLDRCVERGAAWLDKVRPGWEREVDLALLEMSLGCRCILGHITGFTDRQMDGLCLHETGYGLVTSVIEAAGFDGDLWARRHGFDAPSGVEFDALEEAWISLVKDRFDSGDLSDSASRHRSEEGL